MRQQKAKLAPVFYVRKQENSDVFGKLLTLENLIFHAGKNLSQKCEQNDPQYLHVYSVTHLKEEVLELNKIKHIICTRNNLGQLIQPAWSKMKKSFRKESAKKKALFL